MMLLLIELSLCGLRGWMDNSMVWWSFIIEFVYKSYYGLMIPLEVTFEFLVKPYHGPMIPIKYIIKPYYALTTHPSIASATRQE